MSSAECLAFFRTSLAFLASMLFLLTVSGQPSQIFSIIVAQILPVSALYLPIKSLATQYSTFRYVGNCCRLWELISKYAPEEPLPLVHPKDLRG